MDNKRLTTISGLLVRKNHPDGHWLASPGAKPADAYLTHAELIDLVSMAIVIEDECVKYGLEDMNGNHAQVLLRHIYGNKAATIGAKDALIKTLKEQRDHYRAEFHHHSGSDHDCDCVEMNDKFARGEIK